MNLCRLCGDKKSPLDLIVELSDTTSSCWSYRELIEHHTRITLKTSKLLPQSICEECRSQIEGFAEFTAKLQLVQESLQSIESESEEPDRLVVMKESSGESDSDGGAAYDDDSDDWEAPVKRESKVSERTVNLIFPIINR